MAKGDLQCGGWFSLSIAERDEITGHICKLLEPATAHVLLAKSKSAATEATEQQQHMPLERAQCVAAEQNLIMHVTTEKSSKQQEGHTVMPRGKSKPSYLEVSAIGNGFQTELKSNSKGMLLL